MYVFIKGGSNAGSHCIFSYIVTSLKNRLTETVLMRVTMYVFIKGGSTEGSQCMFSFRGHSICLYVKIRKFIPKLTLLSLLI